MRKESLRELLATSCKTAFQFPLLTLLCKEKKCIRTQIDFSFIKINNVLKNHNLNVVHGRKLIFINIKMKYYCLRILLRR